MTENEKELLTIIHESENPEQAMAIAVDIILSFLMQHESSQLPCAAGL